ncbi:CHAT domain-containing protein [Streptomyces sp. NPDC007205]|uniref:CHAT domain-containing protein n=1 Tax=Streptomyces sp. NPDC007205 TaxID=3154316 RepID=UPI0033F5B848
MTEHGPADRLAALIGADTLDEVAQLIRRHGELTGDASMDLLREREERAADAQDRQTADVFSFHARLLYRCRVVGVAETFGEIRGHPVGVTDTWEIALAATAAFEGGGGGTERAHAEEAWRRVLELVPYEADRVSPQARTAALDGLARLLFSRLVTDTDPEGLALDEVVALWRQAVGLPAGLSEAGAAGVVGSLWRVPDITTTLLVACFYQNWRQEGLQPAQALRRAQIWVRDSTNGDKAQRFPDIPEVTRPGMPALHRRLWQKAQPHTGPAHWAAFTYTGM